MALPSNKPMFSLLFCIFVAFASVRAKAASADSDADDTLSDFTNDLFTDLGPLLALFGEQMTKQYISESTTYYDYFIFGMGPIGIITTIVSTIRLCGPASLRAFIGRSKEGNSAIEAELCTSTSRDVCELFNNGGIARVLGRPKILELVRTPKNYLSFRPGESRLNREVGLYAFRDYVGQAWWAPDWPTPAEWSIDAHPSQPFGAAEHTPPNLTLNVGITHYRSWVFCLFASIGLILQAGVLVVAGVGVWVLGWNLDEGAPALLNYAPTIFIIGTVLMCGGMCACITIIGQATTKFRRRRAPSQSVYPRTSIIWLQPRQVIADQSFDPFAFIEDDEKRLSVWTSSMKTWDLDTAREIKFKSATCVAVLAVLVGYILQFIGLRGMRAWVSIAQLITTIVMCILRGILRIQRIRKEDNLLFKKAEIVHGHELDWLAIEITQHESLNRHNPLDNGHTKLTQAKESFAAKRPAARYEMTYHDLMNLRVCLAGIADHGSAHSGQWGAEFIKVHDKAKELAAALEQIAGVFCAEQKGFHLSIPGAQFCLPQGITNKGSNGDRSFSIRLDPPNDQSPSNWRVDYVEIEAILGLTLWCLISDHRCLYIEEGSQLESTRAGDVRTRRIISVGTDARELNGKLALACWRQILLQMPSWDLLLGLQNDEVVLLPLDTNLHGCCSLGRLWQAHGRDTTLQEHYSHIYFKGMPAQDMRHKRWPSNPGAERLCGWSCVLGAQENMPFDEQSRSDKALGHLKLLPETISVQIITASLSLLDICAQELFGAFVAQLQNCAPVQKRFGHKRLEDKIETVRAISQIFQGSGLGSRDDAINCILPALENCRIGDPDRVMSMISLTCDSFLKRSKPREALKLIENALRGLDSPEARKKARVFARALCVLSTISRFEMRNDNSSEMDRHLYEDCCKLWKKETRKSDEACSRFEDFKELHRIHASLRKFRGDDESKKGVTYYKLLEALGKENRLETLYYLCFLTGDDLRSLSAQEEHSVSAALPLAAKQGWFEAVDALMSIGVDPLAQDEAGRTALGYCAEYGGFEHEVCAEIILSHDNARRALKSASWSGDNGRTPLLRAIDQGHDEIVRILLTNGCAVDEQGSRELSPLGDLSPLGEAISRDLDDIVRQLIDAGAELRPEHIDAARCGNSSGIKQLIYGLLRLVVHDCPDFWMEQMPDVIEHCDVGAVQILLDHGATYSFEHIVLGVTKGEPEVRDLFLKLVHNYVAEFPNHTKEWLLKLAEEDEHDTLQTLLDHGASMVWDGP